MRDLFPRYSVEELPPERLASSFTEDQRAELVQMIEAALERAGHRRYFRLDAQPITAEDVKRAMDEARRDVIRELQARQR